MNLNLKITLLLMLAMLHGCVSTNSRVSSASTRDAAQFNVRLGVAYMQQGKNDLALEKLQRAIEQDSQLSSAHVAIALLYERFNDIDKAREHYQRAIRIDPRDP
ncbi:MAG: tetratricopeptide repeat protein, partial [Gammaproteobacteria bacterium]|nr:tetratricopeptide repeat protein [Gammaproteobacteria bacterium]